jgi:hypothetical protein
MIGLKLLFLPFFKALFRHLIIPILHVMLCISCAFPIMAQLRLFQPKRTYLRNQTRLLFNADLNFMPTGQSQLSVVVAIASPHCDLLIVMSLIDVMDGVGIELRALYDLIMSVSAIGYHLDLP